MHKTILRITLWACFVVGLSLGQSLESHYQHEDIYLEQAIRLMNDTPLIDTHVDLPQIIRSLYRNPIDGIAAIANAFPGQVDIPRMRQGRLGAAFFTVWTPCDDVRAGSPGPGFDQPSYALRNALEMLDLIQQMIEQHPDHLQSAMTSRDILAAHGQGRIAALIGMEGTHFLDNSLSVVRIFAQMGVRYLTLTHTCHSAFASSAGAGSPLTPAHPGNSLTALGERLVGELNRQGIMVDLSHVSDETAKAALRISQAPVLFSHSAARALWDHPRNIPDDVLALIGDGPGQTEGLVNSVFYPPFIGPGANLSRVADHIEHIASKIGRHRVGIASDFDGMNASVSGLEDASKYPFLVAEMLARGWSEPETKGLLGQNLMRVMDAVGVVSEKLKQTNKPDGAIWERRQDLPAVHWGGGPGQPYFPEDVVDAVRRMGYGQQHDEL